MSDMITTLAFYMRFPFVRYALIVGVLIALCSSLLGVTLVLKRFSYIGDGLSHVAFGAMAIAAVLNLTNNMVVILPVTVICAIFILNKGKNAKTKCCQPPYRFCSLRIDKQIPNGAKSITDYSSQQHRNK